MWRVAGLALLLVFVQQSQQQTCSIQSNTAYNNAGDIVTPLYQVASAQACCDACAGFEECNYWTYVKDSSSDKYQQCVIKTNATAGSATSDSSSDSGFYEQVYTRQTSCSQESGYDYYMQANLGNIQAANPAACCAGCAAHPGCQYWTLTGNTCYLKASMGNKTASPGLISGTVIPSSVANKPKRTATKRGVALYDTNSCSDIRLLGNISWIYNWAEDPDVLEECLDELGIQFIPMIHDLGSHPEYVYGNSPYLLTFNEPNFADQANMTPQQAADYWPKIEAVADKFGMKISSPSASYGGGNMDPIAWLDEFFQLCTGCRVDFITTHQYSCDASSLHGAIGNFKKYQMPIWVTEFACYGTTSWDDELNFADQILSAFEGDDQIERYAWFGIRTPSAYNNLFDNTKSALSPLGVKYAGGPGTSSSTSTSASSSSSTSTSKSTSTSSSKSSSSTSASSSTSPTSSSPSSTSSSPSSPSSSSSVSTAPSSSSTSAGGSSEFTSGASTLSVAWGILSFVALYIMVA